MINEDDALFHFKKVVVDAIISDIIRDEEGWIIVLDNGAKLIIDGLEVLDE